MVTEKPLDTPHLREFLSADMPAYMIPSHFVPMERMPLTASGKIDRKALPPVDTVAPAPRATYVAPRNDMEKKVADAWKTVLDLDKVGVDDNFFEIGGTSLSMIRMNSLLQESLGLPCNSC